MDWKAFFDVLDHLASHFGGRRRGENWKTKFQISDFGIFRGWSGVTTVSDVGVRVFFTFNETTNGRGRGETLKTS